MNEPDDAGQIAGCIPRVALFRCAGGQGVIVAVATIGKGERGPPAPTPAAAYRTGKSRSSITLRSSSMIEYCNLTRPWS